MILGSAQVTRVREDGVTKCVILDDTAYGRAAEFADISLQYCIDCSN